MRAVVQRVSEASVTVEGNRVGAIEKGLLVYLGVAAGDTEKDADYLAEKVAGLRIFTDIEDKMNLSVQDIGGGILVVSQFTLLADARKGRRPSYSDAAEPEKANRLYLYFVDQLRKRDFTVETGVFQASMRVQYINEGPVTILLDSTKLF
ncbi:D-aminoacyl-tRNA deacylase [Gracilinema caldarium]|uniref:D-aminoacyl-tRNA deacylase n=1 Tax=Gracilinema caldarium (strain ATCC 51460 / DSM 7334 / H1) TaxID=744872 RepID=F8F3E1_GRAC1|nr:D-aminoacyl-tRNA deacylase [Gracilinema caldarium]AEJ19517.1 D-tyrosyl-tRNA(Tyr) deacylase [Gracilinema caldarium DSM 7334]